MSHYSPGWWKRGNNQHERLDHKLLSSLSGSRIPSLRQIKYLPRVLSKAEYLAVKILLAVIFLNVSFLGVRVYSSVTDVVPKNGGRYIEGLVGAPYYVNPVLLQSNDSDRDLSRLIYSGLSRYDNERKIVPDLAERIDISKDEKQYTFTLRPGIQWHDGKPLTATDVLFTIEKIKDPAIKSPLFMSFKDVEIQKVDDRTIRFTLPKPFAPFLDLTTVGIVPQHIWGSIAPESFNLTSYNLKAVGSGAWKFKTIQKDRDGTIRSYTISRNDRYYGQKSYLDEIMFKFYPDIDSAVQALKNRNVDGISFLPHALRDRLVQDRDLGYYVFHLPQYTALFINQLSNPDLKSQAVRQALAYSIDKEKIVKEALYGEGRVVDAPILEGFVGYDPSLKKYAFDLKKAEKLLTSAGWKKDEQGMWTKTEQSKKKGEKSKKRVLRVTLTTVNQEENVRVAELLKTAWTQAGFTTEVSLVDQSRIKQDTIDPRGYEIFLYGEIIGSDPDLYPFWHSSQAHAPGLNLSVFSDPKADTLLEEGRAISDNAKRAATYSKFQQILVDKVPAVFLYNPTYNYVVSKKVKGIGDGKQIVYPSDRFLDSHNWHIKTTRTWKK